jgi:hypothetical protein
MLVVVFGQVLQRRTEFSLQALSPPGFILTVCLTQGSFHLSKVSRKESLGKQMPARTSQNIFAEVSIKN